MKIEINITDLDNTDKNLHISDVSDSLIGGIVFYKNEYCEIINIRGNKVILKSTKTYIKHEAYLPFHNFYLVDKDVLNYH
jgi:hypothetical protein